MGTLFRFFGTFGPALGLSCCFVCDVVRCGVVGLVLVSLFLFSLHFLLSKNVLLLNF